MRELLGGAEENSASPMQGVIDLPSEQMIDSLPIWPIVALFLALKQAFFNIFEKTQRPKKLNKPAVVVT